MQEIMQFVGRHPILSIAWIALLVAVLVTTFKSLTSKVKVITRGEATRLINKEDAVVECFCYFLSPTIYVICSKHVAYEVIAFFDNWSLRNSLYLE